MFRRKLLQFQFRNYTYLVKGSHRLIRASDLHLVEESRGIITTFVRTLCYTCQHCIQSTAFTSLCLFAGGISLFPGRPYATGSIQLTIGLVHIRPSLFSTHHILHLFPFHPYPTRNSLANMEFEWAGAAFVAVLIGFGIGGKNKRITTRGTDCTMR